MLEYNLILHSKEETVDLGKMFASYLFKGAIITLDGDLGAGKTTFAKGVASGLGIEEEVNSPTFNILKCYFNKKGGLNFYHIDAYRLEDVNDENKNVGLEEVIEGDGVCLIEWPKFIEEFIPFNQSLNITLKIIDENTREMFLKTENNTFIELFWEIARKFK